MPGTPYQILNEPRGALQPVLGKVRLLGQITDILRSCLPAPVRDHCQAANVRDRVLVIYADTPAWAARLRYLAPELCRRIQKHAGLHTVQRVEIKTHPAPALPPPEPPRHMHLSDYSAGVIGAAAAATSDPGLQAALRRLTRHARG